MDSIWRKTVDMPKFPTLEGDISTDVLIIGGGSTGILCAYMFDKEGIDYVLVEADRICGGVSGDTTAKITSQHGLIYSDMFKKFGMERTKLYLEINQKAVETYKNISTKIKCDFEEKDNYVYTKKEKVKLENELSIFNKIGWKADYVKEIPIPIDNDGAIVFRRQGQFNPLKFVSEISKRLNIYENTKVLGLSPHKAVTNNGTIFAKNIIVATHFPMNNKHGLYFIKEYQHRSYVIALKNAQNVNGMYVDASKKGLSFRNYNEYLLLGGGGHRTGKKGGKWHELREFAKINYPDSVETCYWATQDCITLDNIPYIGCYSRNTDGLWVATGFQKWGMTSALVSAEILRDAIIERDNEFAKVFNTNRPIFRKQLWCNLGESSVNMLRFSTRRCPHLGCALKWNREEKTWDCSCHGSRFENDGRLINNPATDDMKIKKR